MTEVCGILAASGRALPLDCVKVLLKHLLLPVRVLVNGVYLVIRKRDRAVLHRVFTVASVLYIDIEVHRHRGADS